MRATAATLFGLIVLAPLAIADVHVVRNTDGVQAVQTAVDAAASGDVILVQPGSYSRVIVANKGLSILADGAPVPLIVGGVEVRDIPAGEVFVLNGFRVSSKNSENFDIAFVAEDCSGELFVENCTFVSPSGLAGPDTSKVNGRTGARLSNVQSSVWNRCTAIGGSGANATFSQVGIGGSGFSLGSGDHALFDCIAVAGYGGSINDIAPLSGAPGGFGASFSDFGFFSGCDLTGGNGGLGECGLFCGEGGDGGDAIAFGSFQTPGEAWTLNNNYVAGLGGSYPISGDNGEDVNPVGASVHQVLQGSAKHLEISPVVRVFGSGQAKVGGDAGELAYLFYSFDLAFAPNLGLNAVFMPAPSFGFIRLGLLPESGEKIVPFTAQPINGLDAVSIYLQALLIDGSGINMSGPSALTIVDSAF